MHTPGQPRSRYSKYYNTPARLVVLIREVCNVVIAQSCKYVSGPQIFAMIQNEEAKEAVDKLERVASVCVGFKVRRRFDLRIPPCPRSTTTRV